MSRKMWGSPIEKLVGLRFLRVKKISWQRATTEYWYRWTNAKREKILNLRASSATGISGMYQTDGSLTADLYVKHDQLPN